ncbi:Putative phage-associated protein OS=Thiomonas sp. CB2 GN=THICB2_210003 PE=4 SV=1: DUF4065 [Gemmata massiliana]|uniref:Antitoxin SocA-like Panacea domain-containing protein n=1 Tax=Gemmata massiliana TaxID=1210884 RepID=A0A6P2D6P7_9BACT|nr:type II toxin-antitoxin system antitoxin SocA domain-containing protein [Gemmata massiliana]VTR96136.1 Putative phage-associated protein OS=Thiomonas sp. CB2 GN=THICB2_210003 PE=4 SV=1: DUF4065 [Gemmata massiliana]
MFDAMDVARHLVRLGYDPERPDESVLISPLRLQKLLYYCQGWSLALLGRPLFRQSLQAWRHGPVVVEVYEKFQKTRDGLTPDRVGACAAPLPASDSALVEMVWREYAKYTPEELCDMTHAEPAWVEAWGDLPPDSKSDAVISTKTMEQFFRGLGQQRAARAARPGYPVLDPVAVWMAEEEHDRSGIPAASADEVFAGMFTEAGE